MRGREGVNPPPAIPFHADSNELLFVWIALPLTEILVDCDCIMGWESGRGAMEIRDRNRLRKSPCSWNGVSTETRLVPVVRGSGGPDTALHLEV